MVLDCSSMNRGNIWITDGPILKAVTSGVNSHDMFFRETTAGLQNSEITRLSNLCAIIKTLSICWVSTEKNENDLECWNIYIKKKNIYIYIKQRLVFWVFCLFNYCFTKNTFKWCYILLHQMNLMQDEILTAVEGRTVTVREQHFSKDIRHYVNVSACVLNGYKRNLEKTHISHDLAPYECYDIS